MKAERCQAVTKSGKPCSATVVADGMCAWHAPSWAERRRQWSAEGGRRRSNAARAKKELPAGVMTTDELRGVVGFTIKGVLAGRIEPGIGNSVAALSRAYVAVTEAGAVETLQAQVDELRALISLRGSA
jgi:Family of unknown function (DUF5763)